MLILGHAPSGIDCDACGRSCAPVRGSSRSSRFTAMRGCVMMSNPWRPNRPPSKSQSQCPRLQKTPPRNSFRSLGSWDAASIVVGTIIGSGIFLVPSTMASEVGSAPMVLLVFVVGGTALPRRGPDLRRTGRGNAACGWGVRLPAGSLRAAVELPLRLDTVLGSEKRRHSLPSPQPSFFTSPTSCPASRRLSSGFLFQLARVARRSRCNTVRSSQWASSLGWPG